MRLLSPLRRRDGRTPRPRTSLGATGPLYREPSRSRVLRWSLAWFLLGAGAVFYVSWWVIAGWGEWKPNLASLLIQGAGVCVALALAWAFFEKRSQDQESRIREGVNQRIEVLRNFATWPIMNLSTRLYGKPPYQHSQGGPSYIRDHYGEVRRTLGIEDSEHFRGTTYISEDHPRHIDDFRWIFRQFVSLSRRCEQTLRLFGPALIQYPKLLAAIERVQAGVEGERESWTQFQEDRPAREREVAEWERRKSEHAAIGENPPYPDALPPDAIDNLIALSVVSLGLIATITNILKDWDNIPEEFDMELDVVYRETVGRPNQWGPQRNYQEI